MDIEHKQIKQKVAILKRKKVYINKETFKLYGRYVNRSIFVKFDIYIYIQHDLNKFSSTEIFEEDENKNWTNHVMRNANIIPKTTSFFY